MKRLSAELLPAQAIVQRMQALQLELQQARHHLRRERRAGGGAADRWGLEPTRAASQEEGWFVTYLDMMTLLLVVMIVMLAFSGSIGRARLTPTVLPSAGPAPVVTVTQQPTSAAQRPAPLIPLQGSLPYPAISGEEFERLSGLPSPLAMAPLAGTFPEPALVHAQTEAQDTPAGGSSAPSSTSGSSSGGTMLNPYRADAVEPRAGVAPTEEMSAARPAAKPDAREAARAAIGGVVADEGPGPSVATPRILTEEAESSAASPSPISTNEKTPAAALPSPVDEKAPAATAAPMGDKTSAAVSAAPTEGETLAAALPLGELGQDVEVIVNKQSVSFRVNSEILFDSAQTDLSREGLAVLRRMAHILTSAGYDVTVEGHTDSVPVRSNARFPSNWELSSARAGSVVRYLQANGIPRSHLKAVGLADAHPIADNHTPEGRARNRRVELVVARHHAP